MKSHSRRKFLRRGAATLASALSVPLVVPARVLGLEGKVAPSERLVMGSIGLGGRGYTVLGHFLRFQEVQCVAVADCFPDRREKGKTLVDQRYSKRDGVSSDISTHALHEEILDRSDIDIVLIATGDRWHTPLSVLAARAGKDIFCGKPSTLTIGEGRILVDTMKRYGTVWQCGTQRRSNASFGFFVDFVRSGKIGALKSATASVGPWRHDWGYEKVFATPEPVPAKFDWSRWLGQSPWAPYAPVRIAHWRDHWDTGAGPIADMGPHYLEIVQWALGTQFSGPVEFEGRADFFDAGFVNVPYTVDVTMRYRDGFPVTLDSGDKGISFTGEEGTLRIDDGGGAIKADPASILDGVEVPLMRDWSVMQDAHIGDFLKCVRSRKLTLSHPEITQRAHTAAHCANIALRLGRKVHWSPESELFENDDEANRMLSRTQRAPWRI